jgi:hypothetical protein
MNQLGLFLENRCKYKILVGKKIIEAWCFDGVITAMNFSAVSDYEIIERIGTDEELFK